MFMSHFQSVLGKINNDRLTLSMAFPADYTLWKGAVNTRNQEKEKKSENTETRKFILNLSNLFLTLQHDLVDKMETNEPITNTGTWQQQLGSKLIMKRMS